MRGIAFERALATQWAIQPDSLRLMLAIAAREQENAGDLKAVEAALGRPLDNSQTVSVRQGVASIPIQGPIFRYADLFQAISGGTSVETLLQDFTTALADPSIAAIVLNVDSPGGEVSGVNELADAIYAARGQKPIVAYISNLGASAGYWLASAADEIVVAATALVGNIGVIAAVPDPSARGSKDIEFVSSQSPKKVADPTTETGSAQIQAMVDALAAEFIGTVARNRNTTPERVVADFGQGGILVGKAAVAVGLADRVGSYEGVLAGLAQPGDSRAPSTMMRPTPMRRAATLGGMQMAASAGTPRAPASPTGALAPLAPLALTGLTAPIAEPPTAPEEVTAMDPTIEQALRVACAEAHIAVTGDDWPTAIAQLGAAGGQGVALKGEVERLSPLADLGRQYRADLLEDTLAEGVRAQGDGFPLETYRAVLAEAGLDQLKALKADWATQAATRLPGGRATTDTEEQPAPVAKPTVPNGAFRA